MISAQQLDALDPLMRSPGRRQLCSGCCRSVRPSVRLVKGAKQPSEHRWIRRPECWFPVSVPASHVDPLSGAKDGWLRSAFTGAVSCYPMRSCWSRCRCGPNCRPGPAATVIDKDAPAKESARPKAKRTSKPAAAVAESLNASVVAAGRSDGAS